MPNELRRGGTMRIVVAGATGAIGRQLVPMLLAAGHQVRGTTRDPERAAWLRDAGAEPVVVDVYDAAALRRAVAETPPDAVIHQLTDLAAGFDEAQLRATSRLRQIGTRHLVEAMQAAGVRRLVAQSGAWLYASGPEPHAEDDPLLDPAQAPDHPALPGILELERLTLDTDGIDGIVLRYGFLYGPGTAHASRDAVRGPSIHVAAAARAALLAVEREATGIFNIVDDGGPADNRRARRVLGWGPEIRSS